MRIGSSGRRATWGWWLLACAAAGCFACLDKVPRTLEVPARASEADVPAASKPARPTIGDRSPVDLVLGPGDEWLATANQTSDSVSLVEVAGGRVLDELAVGRQPSAIVRTADGSQLLVSCSRSNELFVLRVAAGKLSLVRKIALDGAPHGLALASDDRTCYVALTTADQIAVVDLPEGQVTKRIDVGRWPRYLALAPDQTRLAVGTSGDRGVTLVDLTAGKQQSIDRFVGLNIGHLQTSRDGQYVYFPWMVYRRNAITPTNIRLGWILASRVARLRLDGTTRREAISLDPPGKAVSDPHGLALTGDERTMVVTAPGTHELLVLRATDLPYKDHGGSDHIDPALLADRERFDRIELGGRPMAVRLAADDRTAYVANYLNNSIQVVDVSGRKIARTIELGGAVEPSLTRRGEAIFLDGRRSLDQWYSCHSCHYDGGTSSVVMDTENDGSSFTFKTVLPLYHLGETGPWTWHGWQNDLEASVRKSLKTTMLGPEPTDDDVAALSAYLRSLRPLPSPAPSDSAAVARGKQVFASDAAACANCHAGKYFTDGKIHDVGLGSRSDRYQGFNTPSLIGVGQKVIWLHDGRGADLKQVLSGPHDPKSVSGTRSLSEQELTDLIAYLKTL